ncbi:MAG: cell division protein FtsZ [Nitratireductor sp.]|nr:cell division protein FtsZ [Nitratireductor sp.]
MTINLQKPDIRELKPKITVFGVGGGGGNAVNNMINGGLEGVEFVVANTDAQALSMSKAERMIQLGIDVTEGLGAGSQPDVGAAAAEECLTEIQDHLSGTHMCFVTAGMGGGTGTGAAPVVARAARELGILTVGVVTKPFQFEGARRMKTAEAGIVELQKNVDTLIVIPNQNLFRIANDKTTFADAFGMADQVLYSGVACITDLMVKEGLINLDFADVRSVMREMGKAMMGTGESSGEGRAMQAAEAAISNPLLDETSMRGAQGLLISITGGRDMTLFEVDEAATRIREEIDSEANIIVGATFDESLDGIFRVSVVATGIDNSAGQTNPLPQPVRAQPAMRPSMLAASPAVRPAAAPAPSPAQIAVPVAETAPIADAVGGERDGVRFAPLKVQADTRESDLVDAFENALEKELMPAEPYVPPAAERPVTAPVAARIADSEEIASPQRRPAQPAAPAEQREGTPFSLLQKLKAGFGVREHHGEHDHGHAAQGQVQKREPVAGPQEKVASLQPAQPAVQPVMRETESPYAPRRPQSQAGQPGQVDQTGRQVPQPRSLNDDDQLDIPAFLRRQAN